MPLPATADLSSYLDLGTACARLGWSRRTVHYAITKGTLKAVKRGTDPRWYVLEADVRRLYSEKRRKRVR